jgi:hypothetical protein
VTQMFTQDYEDPMQVKRHGHHIARLVDGVVPEVDATEKVGKHSLDCIPHYRSRSPLSPPSALPHC